jgi:hypothetical protein
MAPKESAMDYRRRIGFWLDVVRCFFPLSRSGAGVLAIAVIGIGLLGFGFLQGPLTSARVGALVLVMALAEAIYREWDKTAPHDPPRFSSKRAWDDSGFSPERHLRITNEDAQGTFRAAITDIRNPDGSERSDPHDPFPWIVGWGAAYKSEWMLLRDGSVLVPLLEVDHLAAARVANGKIDRSGVNYRAFVFRGPDGVEHGLWAFRNGVEDGDITVRLRVERIDPKPAAREVEVPVKCLVNRAYWKLLLEQDHSTSPAISSQDQT